CGARWREDRGRAVWETGHLRLCGGMLVSSRDIRSVAVFLLIAFGLSWLIALPLWLGDGLASPWFVPVSLGIMFTPAIAALVVVFFVERPPGRAQALGLRQYKPLGRFFGYLALGLVVPVALVLVALPIGALLGVYPADFVNFSAFQQLIDSQLDAAGAGGLPVDIRVLVV